METAAVAADPVCEGIFLAGVMKFELNFAFSSSMNSSALIGSSVFPQKILLMIK